MFGHEHQTKVSDTNLLTKVIIIPTNTPGILS